MKIYGSPTGANVIFGKNNTGVAFGGAAAGGYRYDHTEYTNPTYIWARSTTQGGQDWRWGIPIVKIDGAAGNTLNQMDIYFKKTGSPTLTIIGRLWDTNDPAGIVETLNFESSGTGTTLTGSDITTDFAYYTATIENPTEMTDSHVVGFEATNGTSMSLATLLSNYISAAYENVGANSSNYNGWAGSTDQTWSGASPYRMVQRLS